MSLRRLFCACALAIVSACANVQPNLAFEAAPDPQSGYVASQFNKSNYNNYALVIRALDGGQEYVMALGEDSVRLKRLRGQSVAIKLPPGPYVVSDWMLYRTGTHEIIMRKPVGAMSVLSTPFNISAGSVTHLGVYDLLHGERRLNATLMRSIRQIKPVPLVQSAVEADFKRAYPKLAGLAFRCVFCVDTFMRPGQ